MSDGRLHEERNGDYDARLSPLAISEDVRRSLEAHKHIAIELHSGAGFGGAGVVVISETPRFAISKTVVAISVAQLLETAAQVQLALIQGERALVAAPEKK